MKKIKIGLISHLIYDTNLGCSALAISNLKIMDEIFKKKNMKVEYVVLLAESGLNRNLNEFTSLKGYTNNKFTYKEYPRPKKLLLRPWLLHTTKAFEECDYVVDLCGGDGYTDIYGIKRTLAESIPVFACKFNKVPCYFGPQTIGPFNTFIGKQIAKSTLKKLKMIITRDETSYNYCKELGFEDKTRSVIDVAFALPYEKRVFLNSELNIGINVSGLLYNGGYNHDNYFGLKFSYKEFIDALIDRLEKYNVQLHLIPHVIYEQENVDDDYTVCEMIKKQHPNVILPGKFKTASEAKSYISGMDLFSGARMHSTIAATSSGVPVIPVAYSRKFNGLYDTLGYPFYIDAKKENTVEEALDKFFEFMKKREEMKEKLDKAREIYSGNLEKYKDILIEVMNLD